MARFQNWPSPAPSCLYFLYSCYQSEGDKILTVKIFGLKHKVPIGKLDFTRAVYEDTSLLYSPYYCVLVVI